MFQTTELWTRASPAKVSVRHLTCAMQVKIYYGANVPSERLTPKRLLRCPLNASVEMLGDHWSLLIVRSMMLPGFRTY